MERGLDELEIKDFTDPYLPLTSFVMAIFLISALMAPSVDLTVLGIGGLTLFLGLYGAHYADMLKGNYRTTPRKLEITLSGSSLTAAVVLGLFLAHMTTPWFYVVVAFGTFLTIAYNIELFGGRLHDLDELGYPTFGISWGFIPSLGASMIMGNLTVSTFVMAVGFGILVVPILMLFEASKPVSHESNPLIDKPHTGITIKKSKEMTYKALILIGPALWTFVISGVLNHFGF